MNDNLRRWGVWVKSPEKFLKFSNGSLVIFDSPAPAQAMADEENKIQKYSERKHGMSKISVEPFIVREFSDIPGSNI